MSGQDPAVALFITSYVSTLFSPLKRVLSYYTVNPLNAELNPIRHLLALEGARHIVHVGRVRVKITRLFNLCNYDVIPFILCALPMIFVSLI